MKTARFKLYHSAGLRSARVKWLLHELVGDDFDVEYVDIYGVEQYGSRYLDQPQSLCSNAGDHHGKW